MTQKRSDECVQPTEMWKNEILILGGERSMKGYKKLMDIVAMVEKTVLVVTMLLILVLTVGNVFSRKVIPVLVLFRGAGCCHFRINYTAWRGAVCA